MSEEDKEAINNLTKLVELRKNKAGEIKHDTCICSTRELETILNLIQSKHKEIQKKDKQIDEMASFITDLKLAHFKRENGGEFLGKYRCFNKEEWKQYFERKVKHENT